MASVNSSETIQHCKSFKVQSTKDFHVIVIGGNDCTMYIVHCTCPFKGPRSMFNLLCYSGIKGTFIKEIHGKHQERKKKQFFFMNYEL